MKKTIYFVFFGILFSILFTTFSVLASDQNQSLSANVEIKTLMSITPLTVNFDGVAPGGIKTGPTIYFNATGSNVNVQLIVSSVTGSPFDTGLKLDTANPIALTWTFICVVQADVCVYDLKWTVPSLTVPIGSPAGSKSGIIVYTVTQAV